MRSAPVNAGDTVLASQYDSLVQDAYGGSELLVHQQTSPGMTLRVENGVVYVNGTRVIYAGGNTPSFSAPSTHPRIDVVSIDNGGTIHVTQGSENVSPTAPAYPANQVALCEVYNIVGETAIYDSVASGGGYVSNDVRPVLSIPITWTAFTSDLIPDADGTRNLGSGSFEWNNIYAKSGIFLNGVSVNSQTTDSLLNAESIVALNAVAAALYQADGGVKFDATNSNSYSGGSGTFSLTVGNNTNRILIAICVSNANGATVNTPTYNGVGMTPILSNSTTNCSFKIFYLVAPATGSNTLAFGDGSAGAGYCIGLSYYNVIQTSPIDGSTSALSNTTTFTPGTTGDLIIGFAAKNGTIATINAPNNTVTGGNVVCGDYGEVFPLASTTITAAAGAQIVGAIGLIPVTAPSYGYIQKASSAAANARSSAFIGFASSTGGATVANTVVTGGVVVLSGLLPGAQYYLNDTNGTIGTSPGTVTRKVGIAIDATHLLLTNEW